MIFFPGYWLGMLRKSVFVQVKDHFLLILYRFIIEEKLPWFGTFALVPLKAMNPSKSWCAPCGMMLFHTCWLDRCRPSIPAAPAGFNQGALVSANLKAPPGLSHEELAQLLIWPYGAWPKSRLVCCLPSVKKVRNSATEQSICLVLTLDLLPYTVAKI